MSQYAIIVQNDESAWADIKGEVYHYPNTYKNILTRGCKVIYYKGTMIKQKYAPFRLSTKPHYFGAGVIGKAYKDPNSKKNDWFCYIENYQEFKRAIPTKINNEYLEEIPESKKLNYWRFGVREVSQSVYSRILSYADYKEYKITLPNIGNEFESYSTSPDGEKKMRYSSYYERNPVHRENAIEVHGLSCMVCGFNFENIYGEVGKGFIHVHHNKPLMESGPIIPDPELDLSVVCPNCHAMIHRKKDQTLTLDELRSIIKNTI